MRHQIKYQQNVRMDPQRNLILQSCSMNSLANNNKYQFTFKQTGNKASTPLRHKNYELFSSNNTSPLRFGQVNVSCKNKRNTQKFSVNFNSTMNEDHHKRSIYACDYKQNMSNNSLTPFMSKKSLCSNKDKEKKMYFNRFQTEPHTDPILFIDQQCLQEDQSSFNSSGKINFASKGLPVQSSTKNKMQRPKVSEDNRVFSKLINKEVKDKRNKSLSSIVESDKQQNAIQYLRCKNNDGKKAKYRVISKESIEEDLDYCSKCTIALVQQGFILQKINQEDFEFKKQQELQGSLKHIYAKQLQNAQTMIASLQRRQLQKLNQINQFYNQIIDILSQYQIEDIKIIQSYYSNAYSTISRRIQMLNKRVTELNQEKEDSKALTYDKLFSNLKKIDPLVGQQTIFQFQKCFANLFRPKLELFQENISPSSQQYIQNSSASNNQLRFSFQNPYKSNKPKKTQKFKIKVEKPKQQSRNHKAEKRDAFRDLFPEDQSLQINTDISSPTFKQF